jgi:hypothetical protein
MKTNTGRNFTGKSESPSESARTPILSMIVVPVVYMLMRRRALASRSNQGLRI